MIDHSTAAEVDSASGSSNRRPAHQREDPRTAARDLCRSLLQSDRTLSYREIRKAGEGLGLSINRGLFSQVQRELAGTVKFSGPKQAPEGVRRPHQRRRGGTPPSAALRTESLEAFMMSYLALHREATFEEARAAADASGHFGGRRAASGTGAPALPAPSSGAKRVANLKDLLGSVRRLEAERDELRAALSAIVAALDEVGRG